MKSIAKKRASLASLWRKRSEAIIALRAVVQVEEKPFLCGQCLRTTMSDNARRSMAIGLLAGDGFALTFMRDGVTWTTDVDEVGICVELVRHGGFQRDEVQTMIAWVREHRPNRTTVVDVGANIGTTSIPFALAGYDVLAIEAVPSTFEILVRNVEQNGLGDRIRCVQRAVSEEAEVAMILSGSSGVAEVDGGGTPGFVSDGHQLGESLRVSASGLAELLEEQGVDPSSIALVWSDTQGSETGVIRTGGDLWREVPLFCEFWPAGLNAHAGLDAFVGAASVFSEVREATDLTRARRIGELRALDLRGLTQTDVLLIP